MVTRRRVWSRARPLVMVWSIVACSAGSAACAALFGFERLTEETTEGGSSEASVEGGTDAPPFEGGPMCTEIGSAERPDASGDAGPDAEPGDINMAVDLLDFGIDPTAPQVGFNLDRACSPTLATSTCKTSIDEPTFAKYGADKSAEGIDNAGFGLLGYLATLGSAFSPTGIRERLVDGEFGVVVRLSDWNGTPNDPDVRLEVFPAIGVWQRVDGGPVMPGGKPTFDAGDEWMRDDRYQVTLSNDNSTIKSANAWVTNGRLVATFQSVTLGVSVPDDAKPLDVVIREAIITGVLVPAGTSFKLDQGVLGGRWRTADLLDQVRTIYVENTPPLKKQVLCDPAGSFVYNLVKKEICDGRDIRGASAEDSKGMPCDAFSVGIRMKTYPIDKPGPFAKLPVITPERCLLDGSVPLGDNCAPASE